MAKQTTETDAAQNTKDPSLSWIIGFLFVVSFLGLFSILPLRKVRLVYSLLRWPGAELGI